MATTPPGQYVPAEQATHVDALAPEEVPATQGVGAIAVVPQEEPAGHGVQAEVDAPPRENEPAGQAAVHVATFKLVVEP
jgi:hypothetical protein